MHSPTATGRNDVDSCTLPRERAGGMGERSGGAGYPARMKPIGQAPENWPQSVPAPSTTTR